MFEAPTTTQNRVAFHAAHQARSDAMVDILRWFRKSSPSK